LDLARDAPRVGTVATENVLRQRRRPGQRSAEVGAETGLTEGAFQIVQKLRRFLPKLKLREDFAPQIAHLRPALPLRFRRLSPGVQNLLLLPLDLQLRLHKLQLGHQAGHIVAADAPANQLLPLRALRVDAGRAERADNVRLDALLREMLAQKPLRDLLRERLEEHR